MVPLAVTKWFLLFLLPVVTMIEEAAAKATDERVVWRRERHEMWRTVELE
jgi:hypothetical protein